MTDDGHVRRLEQPRVKECYRCHGTTVTQVADGDGYFDDVECPRCVEGWTTDSGKRPSGDLARQARATPNPNVREWPW